MCQCACIVQYCMFPLQCMLALTKLSNESCGLTVKNITLNGYCDTS